MEMGTLDKVLLRDLKKAGRLKVEKYHKINSIYKRDKKGRLIRGEYSIDEYKYLLDHKWNWTEKVDGTSIRIAWDMDKVEIAGRNDNSQIQPHLLKYLQETFTVDLFREKYTYTPMTLYGEGYGNKIQVVGNLYLPDSVSFALFDVMIGGMYLERENVVEISVLLSIPVVPNLFQFTLRNMMRKMRHEIDREITTPSRLNDKCPREGYVGTPEGDLYTRNGKRIIVKLKYKDFGGGK